VDPTPGTTRDLISIKTALDGWPVEIFDTAGVRKTGDAIEVLGIERAVQHQQTADLVLKVLDRSQPLHADDRELIARPGLLVANKGDLPPSWGSEEPDLVLNSFLTVSAQRGTGFKSLIDSIITQLIPRPPEPGAGVPFRAEQVDQLSRVRKALQVEQFELARSLVRLMLDPELHQD
jgi:tRNA modification GTPase